MSDFDHQNYIELQSEASKCFVSTDRPKPFKITVIFFVLNIDVRIKDLVDGKVTDFEAWDKQY